jgi:hypothetical protein
MGGVSFLNGGIERTDDTNLSFAISEVQTEDSDEEQPPFHWSKHGRPGSHPVARAVAFARTRQMVLSTAKDKDVDENIVLSNVNVKTALARDGANEADLEAIDASAGTGVADQEASSASAGNSHLVLSEAVVPTTAVEFTEQVALIQQMVGVTVALVSGAGDPIDEVDPNQVLMVGPDERIPRLGERSWNRSSVSLSSFESDDEI